MRLYKLLLKCWECSYVFELLATRYKCLKLQKKWQTVHNICLDVFLGFLFKIIFHLFLYADDIAEYILTSRNNTRKFLGELFNWLMGAPAGLKLNHELSHFLGNFFLSHIYVWIGYLHVIDSHLPMIISMIVNSSYFGLSVVLSAVNDFINILACHIYCFYVYAARLYGLQLQSLISLARLFMGKKWNVLRLRVDSVTYEADQLILGTILFTILLFLLPTTLLYYIVFTSLRMIVLIIQTSLYTLVNVVTRARVHEVLLKLKHDIWFHGNDHKNSGALKETQRNLHLFDRKERESGNHTSRVSSDADLSYFQLIKSPFDCIQLDVMEVIKSLLTGKLIKPWNK